MNKSIFSIGLGFLIVTVLLGSCTPKDKAYRDLSGADNSIEDCSAVELLKNDYDTAVAQGNERTSCYLSTYIVPNAEKWKALDKARAIAEPDRYMLSFVELPEDEPTLPKQKQLDDLLVHLSDDGQKAVMVYVHGWRHDAAIGNGNVLRFRTMLGYARSALNSRCLETGAYCDAKLTGVYVGWRGRSFRESTKANAGTLGAVGAFSTVWGRKKQSEKLASAKGFDLSIEDGKPIAPIGFVLRQIEDALNLSVGDAAADKMLTIGHSFGGNMLATYLEEPILDSLDADNWEHGQTLNPVLGDLVVLLNPASESTKWTSIQRKIREVAGVSATNNWVSNLKDATPVEKKEVAKWQTMFPRDQRPFYVSLTAAGNWGKTELGSDRSNSDVASDSATRILFPLSRYVSLTPKGEETQTIGHLTPSYMIQKNTGRTIVAGEPVGASHEFIVNSGVKKKTSYTSSGDPMASRCGSHNGWLRKAQDRSDYKRGFEFWDSSYSPTKYEPLLNNMPKGAELQIRHVLYLNSAEAGVKGRAESVAQGRSPFWNMRGYDTAIKDHSGFINFVTLCGLNTLWLDDATASEF